MKGLYVLVAVGFISFILLITLVSLKTVQVIHIVLQKVIHVIGKESLIFLKDTQDGQDIGKVLYKLQIGIKKFGFLI